MSLTTRDRVDAFLLAQGQENAFPSEYLDMLCDDAESVVLHFRPTVTLASSDLAIAARIAMYWIEKLGYNGASSISENGISRNYEKGDIPDSILRLIVPMAVKVYN